MPGGKKSKKHDSKAPQSSSSALVIPDDRDLHADEQRFIEDSLLLLSNPDWNVNLDHLITWKLQVRAKDKLYSERGWGDLKEFLLNLNNYAEDLMKIWMRRNDVKDRESPNFLYGDAVTGALTTSDHREILRYQDHFEALKRFLDDRKAVCTMLRPLAQQIETDVGGDDSPANLLAALLDRLGESERKAGFHSQVVIPTGILPAHTFISLLSEGRILDDFGAGVVHGELTHRLQWYAILRAMRKRRYGPDGGWQISAVDLYKHMNQPPFSSQRDRSGSAMWSSIADRAVISTATSYGFPGTLHRDLLEAGIGPEGLDALSSRLKERPRRKAWPPRETEYPRRLKRLGPIGAALSHLVEQRLDKAEELGVVYTDEGTHPQEVEDVFKMSLATQGFTERDGCLWPPEDELT